VQNCVWLHTFLLLCKFAVQSNTIQGGVSALEKLSLLYVIGCAQERYEKRAVFNIEDLKDIKMDIYKNKWWG